MSCKSYDYQRDRHLFQYASYWGGDKYRNPPSTSLSTVSTVRESSTPNNDGTTSITYTTAPRNSYLVAHPAEKTEAFDLRVRLAAYVNLVQPIVDAYAESVTANVTRDFGAIEQYTKNVDLKGSSWAEFSEEVARWTEVYGYGATVVDAPVDQPASSQALEQALSRSPYCVFVPPISWAWVEVDDYGQLEEFAYVDQPFRSTAGDMGEITLRVWTREGWFVVTGQVSSTRGLGEQKENFALDKATSKGPLPTALNNQIPVVFSYYKRVSSEKYPEGQSLVDDACDIARLIYNNLSWISEVHRKSSFPFLAVPLAQSGGQMDPHTRREFGPDRAFPYDSSTGAPQWIQPDPKSTSELRDHCVFLFQLALRTAGLELSADSSAQVQSGEALRIRSKDFEARAARFARNMQSWEIATLTLFAKLAGKSDYKPSIAYAKRFVLPDVAEDLATAISLLKDMPVKLGETATVAATKKALNAALSLDETNLEKCISEIRDILNAVDTQQPKEPPDIYEYDINSGAFTCNEVRARKGFGPVSGGDVPMPVYMQQFAAITAVNMQAQDGTIKNQSSGQPPNSSLKTLNNDGIIGGTKQPKPEQTGPSSASTSTSASDQRSNASTDSPPN